MKFNPFFFIFLFIFSSCKKDIEPTKESDSTSKLDYITVLKWQKTENSLRIISGGQTVEFLSSDLPLKSAMVIPTSVLAYLNELNLNEKVIGISQPDFIYNPTILRGIQEKKVDVIGNYNEIFIEKIMVAKPDVLFSTSSPTLAKFHEQLKNQGIKIIFIDEYEELNPLAKAEYVKVIGTLFGKEKEANNLFEEIKTNYLSIQQKLAELNKIPPKIFVNHIYGDVWYMPSGESFQAKLMADAGGNYLWKDTEGTSTLNLSFESVYEKAADADIWINAGDFASKSALLASYPQYKWFKAFQKGQVYNWYKRTTATGANDYFETGTARPDWVLQDLAAIFHPELFPNYEWRFYKKLD